MFKKAKKKKPIEFPYRIGEDDGINHIRYLNAQQQAFDEFQRTVMNFLLPQQIKIKEQYTKWWEDFMIRYELPKGVNLQLDRYEVKIYEKKDQP